MTQRNRLLALALFSGLVLLIVALAGCGGDTEDERAASRRSRACAAAGDLPRPSEEIADWHARRCGTGDLDLCATVTRATETLMSDLTEMPLPRAVEELLRAIERVAEGPLRDDIGLVLDGVDALTDGDSVTPGAAADYQKAMERIWLAVAHECPAAAIPACAMDPTATVPSCEEAGR